METLQRTANRGSISTGYDIDNSLKFEEDNSENITTTNQAAGDRKTWTFSAWIKRTDITYDYATIFGAEFTIIKFLGDDRLGLELYNGTYYNLITTQKFRDTSAWYHIVAVCDTTQATASERSKLYVNGERVTVFDTENSPPLNSEFAIGQAGAAGSGAWLRLGQFFAGSDYFSGYMAEVHYLNGTAKQASDFGKYDSDSGIWIPKQYTGGGYGTQGFYYKFDNSANLGEDSSGEGHDANSINNITSIDQATDTPTNNFCTINRLVDNGFAIWSLAEGGTKGPDTNEGNTSVGTFAVSKGKWYWEGVTTAATGLNYWQWGITRVDMQQGYSGDPGTGSAWYSAENTFLTQTGVASNSPTYDTGITSYTVGDIWSISLNCDVNPYEITLRFNNSVPGTAANNTDRSVGTFASADAVMPYYFLMSSNSDNTWHNFGNPFIATLSGGNTDENGYGDFKYAPPSGYYALCSKNLAEFG